MTKQKKTDNEGKTTLCIVTNYIVAHIDITQTKLSSSHTPEHLTHLTGFLCQSRHEVFTVLSYWHTPILLLRTL